MSVLTRGRKMTVFTNNRRKRFLAALRVTARFRCHLGIAQGRRRENRGHSSTRYMSRIHRDVKEVGVIDAARCRRLGAARGKNGEALAKNGR